MNRVGPNSLIVNNQEKNNVLLALGKVYCKGVMMNVLYDSGATLSFISKDAAKQLRLRGFDISLSITKVGNTTEVKQSKEYLIPLKNKYGNTWEVLVGEIDEITSAAEKVNQKVLNSIFPQISEEELSRPMGQIDLLIGTDCNDLLPEVIDQVGQLKLLKSPLGYCVRG